MNILLLDHDPSAAGLISGMLKKSESSLFKLTHVQEFSQCVEQLNESVFDLIVLEIGLPNARGLSIFNRINRYESNTPIVILTNIDDAKLALKAVKAGAQDYLIKKDIKSKLLIRALLFAMERQKHRNEYQRLSLVASKINNGVIITDKEGIIVWVNEGFGRLTGYILKDVKGTRGEILRKGNATGLNDRALLEKCRESRKSLTYESVNYQKDSGKYWAHTSVTPVFDKRGIFTYFIIVETDITERVRYGEELQ